MKLQKSIDELIEFGILNIDKPSGPTSFNISDTVRKMLKDSGISMRKTSHFGTLDPKVTGVLPVALNRACKLTGFFIGEDKEYVGIMRIHKEISLKRIEDVIKKKFIGRILQTPPQKSRVKRQEREREIKRFDLLEKAGKDILFRAEVQGGTYIRKLISDLGDELGIGMHMLELRRTRAGIFKEENSVNLYDLEKALEDFKDGNEKKLREIIIPGEIVSEVYSAVKVKENRLKEIFTGKPIHIKDILEKVNIKKIKKGSVVSIFCCGKFVGMYRVSDEKNIFAKPMFVMQPIKNI